MNKTERLKGLLREEAYQVKKITPKERKMLKTKGYYVYSVRHSTTGLNPVIIQNKTTFNHLHDIVLSEDLELKEGNEVIIPERIGFIKDEYIEVDEELNLLISKLDKVELSELVF